MSKTALITGAAGSIGTALCKAFAENGYNIIAHCFKNEEKAFSLCREIEERFGVHTAVIKADFSKADEVTAAAEKVLAIGAPDILVNNAGIAHQELFQSVTQEKAAELFAVNTQSAILLTQKLLPPMINRKSGRIINISSMWGVVGASCEVHYSASKAALLGFTKALAKEVGPSGITVNCIAPGLIESEMNAGLSDEALRAVIDETPVGRQGTGDDVAQLAVFLAGEKASFITGQVITVDGGYSV